MNRMFFIIALSNQDLTQMCSILLYLLLYVSTTGAVTGIEPIINFFDGSGNTNQCRTRLERRITGLSGVIYSHSLYGRAPYNASRNCFMMLVAPIGYRIRLRVLEFDVNGHNSNCEKDTLHVFDHETVIDPRLPHIPSQDDSATPGPIIGGQLPYTTKGFRLLWSAFRKIKNDCRDDADIILANQMAIRCETQYRNKKVLLESGNLDLDIDPLTSVSGLYVLLLSGGVVLLLGCICISFCLCCRCFKPTQLPMKGGNSGEPSDRHIPPEPPQFFPPSPPKIPPPSAASGYTPRKITHFDPSVTMHDGYRSVRISNEYGSPMDLQGQNEYTYVRNDVHRNLL
uniref:CUB domain-containing protein n=1 Tax=Heterorhabditis bacteriophora TaxID=37862 RepID=A0A1I7XEC3_HETBA